MAVVVTLMAERAAAFIPRLPLQQLSKASSSSVLKMVAVDDPTTLVAMTHDEYIGTLPEQVCAWCGWAGVGGGTFICPFCRPFLFPFNLLSTFPYTLSPSLPASSSLRPRL